MAARTGMFYAERMFVTTHPFCDFCLFSCALIWAFALTLTPMDDLDMPGEHNDLQTATARAAILTVAKLLTGFAVAVTLGTFLGEALR